MTKRRTILRVRDFIEDGTHLTLTNINVQDHGWCRKVSLYAEIGAYGIPEFVVDFPMNAMLVVRERRLRHR